MVQNKLSGESRPLCEQLGAHAGTEIGMVERICGYFACVIFMHLGAVSAERAES
jgi:hypothetical protein